jgi:hypothetical protein
MQIMLCGLVAATMLQGVMTAQGADARPEWLKRPVTCREAGITEVLTLLQHVGDFTLQISAEDEATFPDGVTMRFNNASVGDVLEFVLGTAGLTYKIGDGQVVQVFRPAKR